MSFFRLTVPFFIVLCVLVQANAAVAADAVRLRLNDRENAVRLVLEWEAGTSPDYTLASIDDRTIEIEFKQPGRMAAFVPDPEFPEIIDVRVVSQETQPLKLWVMLSEKGFKRDLRVGHRLIIDVAQNKALRDKIKRATAAVKQAPVASVENKPVVKTVERSVMPLPVEAKSIAVPDVVAPKLPPGDSMDRSNPPTVALTSTAGFGLAGFIHNQRLWIVVDQPDFLITPRLTGNRVMRFNPFERLDMKDATAFYTDLPAEITEIRGEGGDLYWRIVLAGPKPGAKPAQPERRDVKGVRSVVWPLTTISHLVSFQDPDTQEKINVATVTKSTDFTGEPYRFAEFIVPKGGAGMAVVPLVDDLNIATGDDGLTITRAGGLSVTAATDAAKYKAQNLSDPPTPDESIDHTTVETPDPVGKMSEQVPLLNGGMPLYRFERWSMGGIAALYDNETALIADLAERKDDDRAGGLMNIGKMYLSSGRGAEAVGYFRLAADIQPQLMNTPEFQGLRGAAYALNGQFDLAYEDLRNSGLDQYPDVNVWRAYALANLQDWKQAAEKIGFDISWMRQYPVAIAQPMLLTFAETALRAGNPTKAKKVLGLVDPSGGISADSKGGVSAILAKPYMAQREYLMGEAARQSSKKDEARKYWEALTKNDDNKFRARARLALTAMDYEEGKIKANQAIDQLEGLRYAWRGDEVEASIATKLGEIYLDNGDYLRGMNVLRDAAGLAPDTDTGRRITVMMTDAFRALFLSDKMKTIDPIDAITVYEKFSELIPAGPEANRLTINLVDRLMEVDLLDRAARVMTDLVDHRLDGDQRVEIALRLAATYLLNRQPQLAIPVLNKTEGMFSTLGNPETLSKRRRELILLRARAMFQSDRVDSALSLLSTLSDDVDVLRARADIAWQTGRWSDAATALERSLAMNPVEAHKPPTLVQAELIRNLVVATNLSGDRGRLAQLRDEYIVPMQQTDLFKEFDVVTRERQTPTLADRDSLNKLVSEVDMFGNFLNSYRFGAGKEVPGARTPVAAEPATSVTSPTGG